MTKRVILITVKYKLNTITKLPKAVGWVRLCLQSLIVVTIPLTSSALVCKNPLTPVSRPVTIKTVNNYNDVPAALIKTTTLNKLLSMLNNLPTVVRPVVLFT